MLLNSDRETRKMIERTTWFHDRESSSDKTQLLSCSSRGQKWVVSLGHQAGGWDQVCQTKVNLRGRPKGQEPPDTNWPMGGERVLQTSLHNLLGKTRHMLHQGCGVSKHMHHLWGTRRPEEVHMWKQQSFVGEKWRSPQGRSESGAAEPYKEPHG